MTNKKPYHFQWSQTHPHIAWVDVNGDNTLAEVAVMDRNVNNGDLYYIPLASLDNIDRQRLKVIVERPNAGNYKLWDIMSQTTLRNGMNALVYFQQLVRGLTITGVTFAPGSGRQGSGVGYVRQVQQQSVPVEEVSASPFAADEGEYALPVNQNFPTAQPARRGPGRPAKKA